MREATILRGHVLDVLRGLEAGIAQACCTSPPYWGLRDYQLPPQTWGDGWVGSLGLEATPEQYVAHMVEVFREVRRVMRPDGTLWINLGDSYANDSKWGGYTGGRHGKKLHGAGSGIGRQRRETGLKSMDLVGIPWRVAFALQADGWWLRSDVVWAKPNPMPESVSGVRWERHRVQVAPSRRATGEKKAVAWEGLGKPGGARASSKAPNGSSEFDSRAGWAECPGCAECRPNGGLILRRGSWRPTKAHEYVFLLAASAEYFGDPEAVREADLGLDHARTVLDGQPSLDPSNGLMAKHRGLRTAEGRDGLGRNLRSVWHLATNPYPDAHFATFPPALVEPCIRAGTPAGGGCSGCGAPWAPIVDRSYESTGRNGNGPRSAERRHQEFGSAGYAERLNRISTVKGWRATCACPPAPSVPSLVLDPFAGAGTTGLVALRLGRRFLGIELNPEYAEQARKRLSADAPLFNAVDVEEAPAHA